MSRRQRAQMSLDELLPTDGPDAVEHRYTGVQGAEVGYRGRCACGWITPVEYAGRNGKRAAQGAVAAHIRRAAL